MIGVTLDGPGDFAGFKLHCRKLVAAGVTPERVLWAEGGAEASLFGDGDGRFAGGPAHGQPRPPCPAPAPLLEPPPIRLPPAVADLVGLVFCHRDEARLARLYALIWRVAQGERHVMELQADPLVRALEAMAKDVRRDRHKMHAFVRFRSVENPGSDRENFVSWFEPDHRILPLVERFFVERFYSVDWSILTPDGSLHWRERELTYGPPATRDQAPGGDGFEEWWRGYYRSVFNPARLKPKAMRAEMPKKYWRNLPEAAEIKGLIAGAGNRASAMVEAAPEDTRRRVPASPWVSALRAEASALETSPASAHDLDRLAREIRGCRRCGICPTATAPVPGEGPDDAELLLVGEQPGDKEDIAGRPFVGPAGQLLDRALAEAGIRRGAVRLTNAVKGFKFEAIGRRRVHRQPAPEEVAACKPWLARELELLRPKVVVAMGATALLSLTGEPLKVGQARGRRFEAQGSPVIPSYHPSYLLRLKDERAKAEAWTALVGDLRAGARAAGLVS